MKNLLYFLTLTVLVKAISLHFGVISLLKVYGCGSLEAVAKLFKNMEVGLKHTVTVTW